MLGSLALVLGLILAAAWALRRFGRLGSATGGVLRVRAGLPLGGRERIVLIEAGGKHLLLGVAPGRVQILHVFETPVTPASNPVPEVGGFGRRLSAVLRGEAKP
jgi:flagellar protein FliO/FliZ